jgi:hypothetical protein
MMPPEELPNDPEAIRAAMIDYHRACSLRWNQRYASAVHLAEEQYARGQAFAHALLHDFWKHVQFKK